MPRSRLGDPTARRMLRNVNVQDAPPIMTDNEEAVEHAERWLAFLRNHREAIAAMDFFTAPTITFGMLYCLFVISHDRRRILHVNVTKHPTSGWIIQQLREAFPCEASQKYLISDRDQKFGFEVIAAVKATRIIPKQTSFRSPWQKDYASHCTSCVRCDTTSLARRRCDSFTPWDFLGGLSPGCSYRQWFLSLQV